MTTKEVVESVTDYLNSYSNKTQSFCEEMSREHRTLQQSFTRLCLEWVEHVSSENYSTDGRNEDSKKIAIELLEGFKEQKKKEGYTEQTLEIMSKPSVYLGLI
jgi:hypothetical protein